MDHIGILKRSLAITWRHRALWVFGMLMALAGSLGSGLRAYGFSGGSSRQRGFPGVEALPFPFVPFWQERLGSLALGRTTWSIVLIALAALLLAIGGVIIYYICENALIRMVDRVEETRKAGTVEDGFRLGWSAPAWRMFLIDLILGLPFGIVAGVAIAIGLLPLVLWTIPSTGARVLGTVLSVGMMLVIILILVVAGVALSVLIRIAHREVALAGKGPLGAIGEAFDLIRRHFSDIGMIWLLMLAIGIGWGLLMIPVFLILLAVGGALGGIPAAFMYGITKSIIAATAVGAPVALVTFFAPLLFLNGLYGVFVSAVWTLTFREMQTRETGLVSQPAPGAPEETTEAISPL